MSRAPFATSLNETPSSPRTGRARGSYASQNYASSGIFDSAPMIPSSRRMNQSLDSFAVSTASYESGPRPRIVNGKIVKGEDLKSVPAATGPPSPQNSTGLTWTSSPPVIRRRAVDTGGLSTAVSAASVQQDYYAPAAAQEEFRRGVTVAPDVVQNNMPPSYYGGAANSETYAAPEAPGRATGIRHSSNAFASGANQNCGNVLTDRPTSRVLAPPGGRSSISFF